MPFRPRSTLDIAIGMKVSLHRSDGRLSRGIVRWIGMLPNLPGEYIGVELETQSKFFNYIEFSFSNELLLKVQLFIKKCFIYLKVNFDQE